MNALERGSPAWKARAAQKANTCFDAFVASTAPLQPHRSLEDDERWRGARCIELLVELEGKTMPCSRWAARRHGTSARCVRWARAIGVYAEPVHGVAHGARGMQRRLGAAGGRSRCVGTRPRTGSNRNEHPFAHHLVRARGLLVASLLGSAALGAAGAALAQATNDRTNPAVPPKVEAARRDVAEEVREEPRGKAGPLMTNLKIGPSIGFGGLPVTLAVQLDAGYAFLKGDGRGLGGGDLYLVVSPEVQAGSGVALTVPVGLQYDIPVGIRNVYVYPRTVVGYTGILDASDGDSGDAFSIIPAIGAKFLPSESINLGFEPVVLPVHLGNGSPQAQYRMMAYAGGNF